MARINTRKFYSLWITTNPDRPARGEGEEPDFRGTIRQVISEIGSYRDAVGGCNVYRVIEDPDGNEIDMASWQALCNEYECQR